MIFNDRVEAGKLLTDRLLQFSDDKESIIIGLPRGGVIVAYQVAESLHLPLDVICPRKIGAPFNPEYAIGAITETGHGIFNEFAIQQLGVSESYLKEIVDIEKTKAQHRLDIFRKNRPPRDLNNKQVILIDDGLATGFTMKAAIQSVKEENAKKIIVAIPVAPPRAIQELKGYADEVICLFAPDYFMAIGQFYRDFRQTEDDEVISLLEKNNS